MHWAFRTPYSEVDRSSFEFRPFEGLDLLERLARKRLAGNVVTFTAAISGCAKAVASLPPLLRLRKKRS